MLVAVVLILFTGLLYWILQERNSKARKLLDQIPGPTPLPIIGNVHQLKKGPDFYKQIMEYGTKYQEEGIFKFWVGSRAMVFVTKPDYVENLLSTTKHLNKSAEYSLLHQWLGTGLLTSDADKWKTRRKMLTPTFHFSILNDFLVVFNQQARVLVNQLNTRIGKGSFDVYHTITLCALDIIMETAMGKSINAQETDSEYVQALYRIGRLIDERSRNPFAFNNTLFRIFGSGLEQDRLLKVMHDFTNSVIANRMENFDSWKSEEARKALSADKPDSVSNRKVKLAFLDMLLYMSDNLTKLSIEDIREEVDTFMFEGHDTTASAINWAVHLLGANPAAQSKLQEELDTVFGEDDRDITANDLQELKYLECCIKESLRFFSTVPAYSREINEEAPFGPYTVPKGTNVSVFDSGMHRDPSIYPDPDLYRPERFEAQNTLNKHPYSYVPFSAGPRNCIGQKFALREAKTVLTYIFRNFTIKSHHKSDDILPVTSLVLKPHNGNMIEVLPRKISE